jgi:hypothetical protein
MPMTTPILSMMPEIISQTEQEGKIELEKWTVNTNVSFCLFFFYGERISTLTWLGTILAPGQFVEF